MSSYRAYPREVSSVVVLLGAPGSGKSAVGEELAALGLRWREWERAIVERWGSREDFVANKAEVLEVLHDQMRAFVESPGAAVAIETTGLSESAFLDDLSLEHRLFVVRLDVSPRRRDRPSTNRIVWQYGQTGAPGNTPGCSRSQTASTSHHPTPSPSRTRRQWAVPKPPSAPHRADVSDLSARTRQDGLAVPNSSARTPDRAALALRTTDGATEPIAPEPAICAPARKGDQMQLRQVDRPRHRIAAAQIEQGGVVARVSGGWGHLGRRRRAGGRCRGTCGTRPA